MKLAVLPSLWEMKNSCLSYNISVQPRIRLIRSFDERSHNYLGYALFIRGLIYDPTESDHLKVDGVQREFSVGIGKAAQQKHQFCVGDEITGEHPSLKSLLT